MQNIFAQTDDRTIAKCNDGYTYISDLDNDKKKEKLCLKKSNKKFNDDVIYDIIIYLSKYKKEIKLGTTNKTSNAEGYYEIIEFKSLNSLKFKKIKNKYGLRMGYNEKSSRIYYWSFKYKKLIEIEESD